MPQNLIFRQPILAWNGLVAASGGVTTGSGNSLISNILFGTVTITCPSATASNTGSNAATIAGLASGAKVFVTCGSIPQGFVLVSASATAANTLTGSFLNATTANISSSALVTLQYLAIS